MKRVVTVKTKEKAEEVLDKWLDRNLVSEEQGGEIDKRTFSTYCECGETMSVRATVWNLHSRVCDHIAFVGVCDVCGDDDAFENDVINEY